MKKQRTKNPKWSPPWKKRNEELGRASMQLRRKIRSEYVPEEVQELTLGGTGTNAPAPGYNDAQWGGKRDERKKPFSASQQ